MSYRKVWIAFISSIVLIIVVAQIVFNDWGISSNASNQVKNSNNEPASTPDELIAKIESEEKDSHTKSYIQIQEDGIISGTVNENYQDKGNDILSQTVEQATQPTQKPSPVLTPPTDPMPSQPPSNEQKEPDKIPQPPGGDGGKSADEGDYVIPPGKPSIVLDPNETPQVKPEPDVAIGEDAGSASTPR